MRLMAKHGSRPGPDCYCLSCKSKQVVRQRDPAKAREAKARYVSKHGREKINADERRRKNHLPLA